MRFIGGLPSFEVGWRLAARCRCRHLGLQEVILLAGAVTGWPPGGIPSGTVEAPWGMRNPITVDEVLAAGIHMLLRLATPRVGWLIIGCTAMCELEMQTIAGLKMSVVVILILMACEVQPVCFCCSGSST